MAEVEVKRGFDRGGGIPGLAQGSRSIILSLREKNGENGDRNGLRAGATGSYFGVPDQLVGRLAALSVLLAQAAWLSGALPPLRPLRSWVADVLPALRRDARSPGLQPTLSRER